MPLTYSGVDKVRVVPMDKLVIDCATTGHITFDHLENGSVCALQEIRRPEGTGGQRAVLYKLTGTAKSLGSNLADMQAAILAIKTEAINTVEITLRSQSGQHGGAILILKKTGSALNVENYSVGIGSEQADWRHRLTIDIQGIFSSELFAGGRSFYNQFSGF